MKRLGTTHHKDFGVRGVPGPIVGKRVGVEVFGCGRNVQVNVANYLFQKLPRHLQRYADISDKVSELHARPLSVVSITNGPSPKPQDDNVGLLLGEVRSLSWELQKLKF